jgi:hypothetical protein
VTAVQSRDDGDVDDLDEDTDDNTVSEPQEDEEHDDLPVRLRWAQEHARQAIARDRQGQRLALLPAARQLEGALTFFMHDGQVWDRLRCTERQLGQLSDRDRLRLLEIQDQDLSALLVYLGYRPPPPSEKLQRDLRESVETAIAGPGSSAARAARTRRVHDNLFVFVYRLRGLIKEAQQIQDAVSGTVANTSRQERIWRGLRAGLRKGAVVAGPAALAAGATTMAFPPSAPANAAAGLAAIGNAAMQEAVKTYVQFGATNALDRVLADEPGRADPKVLFAVAARRARRAILEAASVARAAGGEDAESIADLVPADLELTSSELALRMAALDVDVPRRRFAEVMNSIAASTLRLRRLAKKRRLSPAVKEQFWREAAHLDGLLPQLDRILSESAD